MENPYQSPTQPPSDQDNQPTRSQANPLEALATKASLCGLVLFGLWLFASVTAGGRVGFPICFVFYFVNFCSIVLNAASDRWAIFWLCLMLQGVALFAPIYRDWF